MFGLMKFQSGILSDLLRHQVNSATNCAEPTNSCILVRVKPRSTQGPKDSYPE